MSWPVFRALMLRDLAVILDCKIDTLPLVFHSYRCPKALALGIDRQLLDKYPDANNAKLGRWLQMWTRRAWNISSNLPLVRIDMASTVQILRLSMSSIGTLPRARWPRSKLR
jgi:hypothetical protein